MRNLAYHFDAILSHQSNFYYRLLTSEMFDVFLGLTRKKFHLHKDLLCDRSDYFKAAFQGDFQEATMIELYLPR